ncbi:MAG TPA: DUF4349 domain-containing protein [Candidatus Limnocylindrales bacterium]|nr:DUF4349 domain-containing protein [Candidatus Limnocylindrales bacterium]
MSSLDGRRRVAAPLAILVLLLVAACAGGAATADKGLTDVGAVASDGFEPAGPAAMPSAADEGSGAGARSSSGGSGGSAPLPSSGPLIVKTGTLDLQVADVDAALVKARTAVAGLGGFVSGSAESSSGRQPTASITYRIPAQQWDAALADLRKLASKVLGEKTEALEVTGQVLDLEARIANLKVTEAALQAIMAKATKISDVLAVQDQLTDVQGQIEQLSTQQAHLQDQASYGTLTVAFSMPVAEVEQAQQGWDPGTQLDQAVAQLVQLAQGGATLAIWLIIVALPFLLVLGLVLGFVLLIVRRVRPRRDPSMPLAGGETPPAS